MVIAPSLIPITPGERIKTDRRDVRKLAFLFRAGLLTEVQPPSEADEAVRDLSRAREDVREDLLRSRHRLSKMLLRRGIVYTASKRPWSQRHRHWLKLVSSCISLFGRLPRSYSRCAPSSLARSRSKVPTGR